MSFQDTDAIWYPGCKTTSKNYWQSYIVLEETASPETCCSLLLAYSLSRNWIMSRKWRGSGIQFPFIVLISHLCLGSKAIIWDVKVQELDWTSSFSFILLLHKIFWSIPLDRLVDLVGLNNPLYHYTVQQFCRGQGIVEVQKMMSVSLTLRSNLMIRIFLNFFCPPHLLSLYHSWSTGMVIFWSSSVYLKARSSRILTHRSTGVDNPFRV